MGVVGDGGKVDDQHGRLPPLKLSRYFQELLSLCGSGAGVYFSERSPRAAPLRWGYLRGLQLREALWAEAGPMLTVYLYNWSLNVAQRHNVITCFIIEGDINSVVSQTSTVKGFFSSGALDASWLGVKSDRHCADLTFDIRASR